LNFLITGGTGFVGSHLTASLHENGHHTYVLSRSADKHADTAQTTFISYDHNPAKLPAIDGVINLAGESLFGIWTEEKKQSILGSRLDVTNRLIEIIRKMDKKPDVFISGSAVGYYGFSDTSIFTEATTESGSDFLADVSTKWEHAARLAEEMGIRTVYTRFGVILGKEGALPLMKLPVKMFAGGKIGNGQQWISWVHVKDVVRLIEFCLFHKEMEGPVNVTAPNPKRNKDFMKTLAKVLRRPYSFPVPASLVEAVVGDMGQLITKGQYVSPAKALDNGFSFAYPRVKEAFQETTIK